MRLNAYLARAGVTSRRGADNLIKAGRVIVNDKPGQLNTEVSEVDTVELDGKKISAQKLRYILMNKPPHVITTLKDTEARPVVTDLLDIEERVVPVGRLDANTTGALLLTNDGELANKLMHPSFKVDKVYEAEVEGQITDGKMRKLEQGVPLEDGKTAPAKALMLQGLALQQKVELTIHEGRKHQVKRMLAAVSLPLKRLHRSKYDSLDLSGLNPGQWRDLREEEVDRLKHL